MVLATCAVLAILLSLSNREILAGAQSRLERRVQDSADDVTLEDGGLRVDSDFYSVTKDVYLSLYTEDMYFLYGSPMALMCSRRSRTAGRDGSQRGIRTGMYMTCPSAWRKIIRFISGELHR